MASRPEIPEVPEVDDFPVGQPTLTPYMVAQLKHHCPPNIPEEFWNRIVEVTNEEMELNNCWEPVREGKFRLPDVLSTALKRLEELQEKNANFASGPYSRSCLSVCRTTPNFSWGPTPQWSTKEEHQNVINCVKEKYYHPLPHRTNVSTKRYQQAIKTGEMKHEITKELIKREKANRKDAEEGKLPKPCQKCGFGHQTEAGCAKFTSASQIRMMIKAVQADDSDHPKRQIGRSTRFLESQLKKFTRVIPERK